MRSSAFAACAIVLGACVDSVGLKIPPEPARSMLIIIVPENEAIAANNSRAYAYDLDAPLADRALTLDRSAKIYAILYDRPLIELQIDPGNVEVSGGECPSCIAVPASEHVFSADRDSDAWARSSFDFHALFLVVNDPCNHVTPPASTAGGLTDEGCGERLAFATPIPGGRILAVTESQCWYSISESAHERLMPNLQEFGAISDANGAVWMIDEFGELSRATVGTEIETTTIAPAFSTNGFVFSWLSIDPEAPLSDMYLFAIEPDIRSIEDARFAIPSLHRLNGDHWEPIAVTCPSGSAWQESIDDIFASVRLARLPDGSLLVARLCRFRLVRISGSNVDFETVEDSARNEIDVLTELDGFGIIAGTDGGHLFQRTGDRWVQLPDPRDERLLSGVSALGELGGHLFYFTTEGLFGIYDPTIGKTCGSYDDLQLGGARLIAPFSKNGPVFASGHGDRGSVPFVTLR